MAKRFTYDAIYLNEVKVVSKGRDRYGRIIGFIRYGNGKDLSKELLASGLAWHYKRYSNNQVFAEIEKHAQSMRLGLWQEKSPTPPWEWRHRK